MPDSTAPQRMLESLTPTFHMVCLRGGQSDDLAVAAISRQANFIAARLNGTDNCPQFRRRG
jgi:hypothetical protein